MRYFASLLITLLLCGCGSQLIQTQEITLAPEAPEPPAPPRVFRVTGGVISNYLFTAGAGYNGIVPPVNELSRLTGQVVVASSDNNQLTLELTEGPRSLRLGVLAAADELAVGQAFSLPPAFVSLTDVTGQGQAQVVNQAWTGASGSLTVTDLTDTSVELDFDFTDLQPTGGNAAGTFTVSGHIQADVEEVLP